MLIGFLGAPCSGKSTTASRLFADFKERGYSAEFINEQARIHIAQKRLNHSRSLKDSSFHLTDNDQFQIATAQYDLETLMASQADPDTLIITDTSVLNSALYVSEQSLNTPNFLGLISKATLQYDLLFLCDIVTRPTVRDLNRIHSPEESFTLHDKLLILLDKFASKTPTIRLAGSTILRLQHARTAVLERLAEQ